MAVRLTRDAFGGTRRTHRLATPTPITAVVARAANRHAWSRILAPIIIIIISMLFIG